MQKNMFLIKNKLYSFFSANRRITNSLIFMSIIMSTTNIPKGRVKLNLKSFCHIISKNVSTQAWTLLNPKVYIFHFNSVSKKFYSLKGAN